MAHNPVSQAQRLLSGMIHALGRKPLSRKDREVPDVPGQPTLGIRCPHLSILCDSVLEPLCALVRLSDHVVRELLTLGEPQDRLVERTWKPRKSGEVVFIVPDELATVCHPNPHKV